MGMVLFHNKYLRKGNIQIRQAKSYTKNLAEAGLYMDTWQMTAIESKGHNVYYWKQKD